MKTILCKWDDFLSFFNEQVVTNNHIQTNEYCYVKAAGILTPDPQYSITRQNSHTTIFAYVLSGEVHIETKDAAFTLRPGDCYIIPSEIYSKVYSDTENPHSMIWVNCRGILIDELYKIYFDKNIPVISTCNIEAQLRKIMEVLKRGEYENQQDKITLLLHEVMLLLKKSMSFKINKFDYRYSNLEERISCYITTHMQEKFEIENICKTFFISVSKLNEIFRKAYNCTPHQYYQMKRFNIAKKMLTETDLSIDDIALRLNFVDRNHFSKFFFSRQGVSPANYRKNKDKL